MGFPVRTSLILDLTFVPTREKVVDNFFSEFIHDLLVVDEIENLSALVLTQTNYPLRAITAYKNYHNTQKGNFSLAPDHFRGRKLIC